MKVTLESGRVVQIGRPTTGKAKEIRMRVTEKELELVKKVALYHDKTINQVSRDFVLFVCNQYADKLP